MWREISGDRYGCGRTWTEQMSQIRNCPGSGAGTVMRMWQRPGYQLK